MPKPKDTLDRININTPCKANWDEMIGNEQVRFCSHCDLDVHDLSAMTRQEALRLVINSKGKLCARYTRKPDGPIQTTDLVLPRLHSISRRASRIAATAFSAALSVSTSVVAAGPAQPGTMSTSRRASILWAPTNSNSLGTSGASVMGVVKDSNGAVVPGAEITLTNESSGLEYTTSTDDEGKYRFDSVEEGSFSLTIKAPGFQSNSTTNIALRAQDEQRFDTTLDVAWMSMGGAVAFSAPSEPLVSAAVAGDLGTVKELLATGTDVDTIDDDFGTALAQAVANGNQEIVDVLLNAGADVNKSAEGGHTPLMSMTGSTSAEIVSELINAGAKIDLRDEDGKNALHYAAGNSTPEVVRALLYGGASVDARDDEESTALIIAATAGNTEIVEVLLRGGATVNLRDKDGATALGLALENDNPETAEALKAFGATE